MAGSPFSLFLVWRIIVRNFLKYLYAIRILKRAIRTYLDNPLFDVGCHRSNEDDYVAVARLQRAQNLILHTFRDDVKLDKWQRDVITQQLDDNDLIMRIALVGRKLFKESAHNN